MTSIHESGSDVGIPVGARRTRRRWMILGVATAVAAAIGVGFVVQSPTNAASADRAPMGSQLPWDESGPGDQDGLKDGYKDGTKDGFGEHRDQRDHRGPGIAQRGERGSRFGGLRELLATAAQTLGISEEELVDEWRNGMSIAEIAAARNIEVQDVIDAMVNEVVSTATERITDLVNRKPGMSNSPASTSPSTEGEASES